MVEVVPKNQFLVEVEMFNSTSMLVETERFATGAKGFQTLKTETPARAKYQPFLKDSGNVTISLFGSGRTNGQFSVGVGNIIINNADGQFDFLEDRGIDGRNVVIRERVTPPYPSGAPIRFSGLVSTVVFSSLLTTFNIRSRLNNLRTLVYQTFKYAGTNDTSSIFLEGLADGIQGLPKPKIVADISENFAPTLVEEALLIYQVSSDPAKIETVYIGRSKPTLNTLHTSLSAFITAVGVGVPAGTFDSYEGDFDFDIGNNERGTYFALGSTPTKRVTADARVDTANLLNNSNKYNDASWTKTRLTAGTQDQTDPLATTKATQLTEDGTASSTHFIHQDVTIIADRFNSHSLYVKPNGRTKVRLTVGDAALTDKIELNVTLTGAGTVDSITASGVASNETGKITLVDQGFYRIEIVGKINGTHTTLRHQLNLLDSGGSDTFNGDSTSGVFVWQSQTEVGKVVSPAFEATTAAISGRKNTIGQSVFRVMNDTGFELDPLSVIKLDQRHVTLFTGTGGLVQNFQSTREANPSDIINPLLESSHAFLEATIDEKFKIGQWDLPTVGESELTIDNKILLGTPKVKKIQIQDRDRGVPVNRVNIGFRENYSIMTEEDVFGVAEITDVPFTSKEFRVASDNNAATLTKHLSSPEKNIDSKLTDITDAQDFATFELGLYDTQRQIIEIRIPRAFGDPVEPSDVITLDSKVYRVMVKRNRFPNSSKSGVTVQAQTFQAWGGISI